MASMRNWGKWLVAKASRDTTSGLFIAEIDGLRFVAIFAVILFHLSGYIILNTGMVAEHDPLAALLSHGSIGVPLFFIISGFVIALPFAKGHLTGGRLPQVRQYFFRRLTRLEPPYIASLLIICALIPLAKAEKAVNLMPHLFASLGYVHNIIYGKASLINGVAWSLEVELQFYVLAPILTLIFKIQSRLCRRSILVAIIALFSIMAFMIDGFPRYNLSVLASAQFFLTGFLLVDVYLIEWDQRPVKSFSWDLVSALAWFSVCALLFQGRVGHLFIVIPMFVAYCAAFKGVFSNRVFCNPIIYTIGGMCYTIYLYHNVLTAFFIRLLVKTGIMNTMPLWGCIIVASLVLVPIILLFTTLMFVFFEKPFMSKDWHIRLLDRLKGRVLAWGQ